MDNTDLKQIYIDLRQQLYPIMGEIMTRVLMAFEKALWAECFQACNSMKILISSEMNMNEKSYFESVTDDLRQIVWAATGKHEDRDAKVKVSQEIALSKLPVLLENYMQLLFKEMSNQGIWFPKSKRHETFNDLLLDETFGLKPEGVKEKVDKLKLMSSEEILKGISRQELEKLYVKRIIKDVLQE